MNFSILEYPGDDLRGVNLFLNNHAKKRYGALPPPMLDIYCVADQEDEIRACCGASLASVNQQLHLESLYAIDEDSKKQLPDRSLLCEIGRWVSEDATAALPVLKLLIEYLQSKGITHALCELKSPTVRRANSYGLTFHPLKAILDLSKVDPTGIDYYSDLPPDLYLLSFKEIIW